jgi:hypothetical protein
MGDDANRTQDRAMPVLGPRLDISNILQAVSFS